MTNGDAWLIDKSALWRIGQSPDRDMWINRIERGLVKIGTPTLLEVGYSAQSGAHWVEHMNQPPVVLMPILNASPLSEARAVEVQGMLAQSGEHRAPSIPDLLLAALAELDQIVLLHLDKDFELIARVTGQQVQRLRI